MELGGQRVTLGKLHHAITKAADDPQLQIIIVETMSHDCFCFTLHCSCRLLLFLVPD